MGSSLGWALLSAIWWRCWTFDIYRRLWHMPGYPFAQWASNIPFESVFIPMIATLSGSRKSLHWLLSGHSPLFQGLNILGMGGRSPLCIRCPLLGRIVLPRPLAFLWPPYYQVTCRLWSMRLRGWSSYSWNLFPTHRWHLSMAKTE